MSAFIVGNYHISVMLQDIVPGAYYYWNGVAYYLNGNRRAVGQKLLNENYRSVNYRYDKRQDPLDFRLASLNRQYSPIEIIKACDCYDYQACETTDWKDTEAHAIVKMLRERAICALPRYEEAAWEIRG